MHAELKQWLKEVWDKRDALLATAARQGFIRGRGASAGFDNDAVWEVYQMYTGGDPNPGTADDAHVGAMQSQLARLESAIATAPELQIGDDFYTCERGWVASADLQALSHGFLHYRRARAVSTHRVYINVGIPARGHAFRAIVDTCGLWNVAGLNNAKLAVPGEGDRNDSIVVYLASAAAAAAALRAIAECHRARPHWFLAPLPRLIEPAVVDGYVMAGVGTAMEPPAVALVSTGGVMYRETRAQSFGGYRSALIYMALERTKSDRPGQLVEQRHLAFVARVEKYFRRAGIDPDRPNLQAALGDLPPLDSLRNWANMTDGSRV